VREALFFHSRPRSAASEAVPERATAGPSENGAAMMKAGGGIRPCSFCIRFPFLSKRTDRKPDCLGQKASGQAAGDSYPDFHFLIKTYRTVSRPFRSAPSIAPVGRIRGAFFFV